MKDRDYKPIAFRQLCMVVKTILQRNPSIDDAEWKAKTQDTLEQMGFDAPSSDMLARAMNAVENALKQTVGPRMARPIPSTPQVKAQPPEPIEEPKGRTHRPAGWDIVLALMQRLDSGSKTSAASLPPRPTATPLGIDEDAALREFWRQQGDRADRLGLLQAFAEVAIVRPAEWDYLEVRRNAHDPLLAHNGCFVCGNRDRAIEFHHVIQIQHGGSNTPRNRVPLCSVCHDAVHPWLGGTKRTKVGGWTQVGAVELPKIRKERDIA
jgi:hypothetical protein